VPRGAGDLLDVGCGDGLLACSLAGPGRRVLGIDPHAGSIERARARGRGVPGLAFEQAGLLDRVPAPESLDFVSFVASLHHMDQDAALVAAREALRPGGRLVVVGLSRNATRRELLVSGACAPLVWFADQRPDRSEPAGMPVREPDLGWAETRALAREVLPGARWRRHLYYRYVLRWAKP
jgi:SAM-dependent methyltransferase